MKLKNEKINWAKWFKNETNNYIFDFQDLLMIAFLMVKLV